MSRNNGETWGIPNLSNWVTFCGANFCHSTASGLTTSHHKIAKLHLNTHIAPACASLKIGPGTADKEIAEIRAWAE